MCTLNWKVNGSTGMLRKQMLKNAMRYYDIKKA